MTDKKNSSFEKQLTQSRKNLVTEYLNCQEEIASGENQMVWGTGHEQGDISAMHHHSHMNILKLDLAAFCRSCLG